MSDPMIQLEDQLLLRHTSDCVALTNGSTTPVETGREE